MADQPQASAVTRAQTPRKSDCSKHDWKACDLANADLASANLSWDKCRSGSGVPSTDSWPFGHPLGWHRTDPQPYLS
jgi:hypothetical protein